MQQQVWVSYLQRCILSSSSKMSGIFLFTFMKKDKTFSIGTICTCVSIRTEWSDFMIKVITEHKGMTSLAEAVFEFYQLSTHTHKLSNFSFPNALKLAIKYHGKKMHGSRLLHVSLEWIILWQFRHPASSYSSWRGTKQSLKIDLKIIDFIFFFGLGWTSPETYSAVFLFFAASTI